MDVTLNFILVLSPSLCTLSFGKFTTHCFKCHLYVNDTWICTWSPIRLFMVTVSEAVVWHLKMWELEKNIRGGFLIYSFIDESAECYRHAWGHIFYLFILNFIYFLIQQVLISHPFYTHQCIHVNLNLPIHHTTTPTPCCFPPLVSIRLFSTSVSISVLQTGSSVPFF